MPESEGVSNTQPTEGAEGQTSQQIGDPSPPLDVLETPATSPEPEVVQDADGDTAADQEVVEEEKPVNPDGSVRDPEIDMTALQTAPEAYAPQVTQIGPVTVGTSQVKVTEDGVTLEGVPAPEEEDTELSGNMGTTIEPTASLLDTELNTDSVVEGMPLMGEQMGAISTTSSVTAFYTIFGSWSNNSAGIPVQQIQQYQTGAGVWGKGGW